MVIITVATKRSNLNVMRFPLSKKVCTGRRHLLPGWPSTIIIIAIDTSIIIATKSIMTMKIIMLTMLIMISNNTNHHPIIINTVIIKMVHSCRVAPSASAPMSVAATLVIDSSIVERILALFTYIYELPLP